MLFTNYLILFIILSQRHTNLILFQQWKLYDGGKLLFQEYTRLYMHENLSLRMRMATFIIAALAAANRNQELREASSIIGFFLFPHRLAPL